MATDFGPWSYSVLPIVFRLEGNVCSIVLRLCGRIVSFPFKNLMGAFL